MSLRAGRESPAMTIAMFGCLLGCAVAYAVPLARTRGDSRRSTAVELATPLALTAGMVGMLAMP
jgi:NhaP-type Na+/H+ or K+/H+ antiporter